MEATLQALGQILLKALPTLFLVLLLHLYLKRVFFGPLERVRKQRYDATGGAKKAAESAMEAARQKMAAYEEALRAARGEIFREQESMRKQWREERAAALARTQAEAAEMVAKARAEVAADVAAARAALRAESEALSEAIVHSLIQRRIQ